MSDGTPYHQPADRRPIAARQFPLFESMAGTLARLGISANAVSMAGLVFGISAGAALWWTSHLEHGQRLAWLAAAAFVQLRLLMNMLDGMVAIKTQSSSRRGELFN